MSDDVSLTSVVTALQDNRVPDRFWELPEFANRTWLSEVHAEVVRRLQEESPDADILELMMMERVCFLYIFMRASEMTEGDQTLTFTRTYKDMMSLWVSMAADLRKARMRAEEAATIRLSVVTEVSRALKEALKDFDPAISHAVQTRLVTLVA